MASQACEAAGPPLPLPYAGSGKVAPLPGAIPAMDCYEAVASAGTTGGKVGVVVLNDIFGFGAPPTNGNVRRVCDKLAEAGFHVAMPDYYRGAFWPLESFPPGGADDPAKAKWGAWWAQHCESWDHVVMTTKLALERLKRRGCSKYGLLGFCWGGREAVKLASSGIDGFDLAGIVGIHAARIKDASTVADAKVPICLLQSGSDPALDAVRAELAKKAFASLCVLDEESFKDEIHGFCAARGDWNNAKTGAAAAKAISTATRFFRDVTDKEKRTEAESGAGEAESGLLQSPPPLGPLAGLPRWARQAYEESGNPHDVNSTEMFWLRHAQLTRAQFDAMFTPGEELKFKGGQRDNQKIWAAMQLTDTQKLSLILFVRKGLEGLGNADKDDKKRLREATELLDVMLTPKSMGMGRSLIGDAVSQYAKGAPIYEVAQEAIQLVEQWGMH